MCVCEGALPLRYTLVTLLFLIGGQCVCEREREGEDQGVPGCRLQPDQGLLAATLLHSDSAALPVELVFSG